MLGGLINRFSKFGSTQHGVGSLLFVNELCVLGHVVHFLVGLNFLMKEWKALKLKISKF